MREEGLDLAAGLRVGARGWSLRTDLDDGDPAARIAADEALCDAAEPTIRLWTNGPALVLGRREVGQPGRIAGERWARRAGWRVVERPSGGTLLLHDRTVLNITLSFPAGAEALSVANAYRLWHRVVGYGLLASWSVETTAGSLPHTYCDGLFNLVAKGKKLAGTAQFRRRGAIVVHGTLLVNTDRVRSATVLNRFYAAAGWGYPLVDPDRLVTLRDLTGLPLDPAATALTLAASWHRLGLLSADLPASKATLPSGDKIRTATSL